MVERYPKSVIIGPNRMDVPWKVVTKSNYTI